MRDVYHSDGTMTTMSEEAYVAKYLNGVPLVAPKVTPPAGYVALDWHNVGDMVGKTAALIRANGGAIPTPNATGLDNTVIGVDGKTNYQWVVINAIVILGYMAVSQAPNATV